jgi:O-antigen ligase
MIPRRGARWASILTLLIGLGLLGVSLGVQRGLRASDHPTFYPATPDAATWEGEWIFSERGADPAGEDTTERVKIPFSGTGLALRVRRGPYRGYLYVWIDGQPAHQLPQDERGAYLVLTSPQYQSEVVTRTVATGLAPGSHTAVIEAERGWSQWPLVGWVVTTHPSTAPYDGGARIAGLLALAGLAGLVGWGPPTPLGRVARRGWALLQGALLPPLVSLRRLGAVDLLREDRRALAALAVSATVFYLSPWLPLTLVAGVALAGVVLLRLDLGLALVVATAPLYRYPKPLLGKTFSMAEIATLLSLASWAVRRIVAHPTPGGPGRATPLDRGVIFFVLVALVSLVTTEHRHVALRELRVTVVEPALVYAMVRTTDLDERQVWRLVDLLVLSATVVAVVGLVQYGLGVNVITAEQGMRRLRSIYGSPNNAALYLGRVLPVSVAIALFAVHPRRRRLYGLAALPIGAAAVLTFSKGAILLGLPLPMLALGFLAGGRWLWAAVAALVVGGVAALPILRTPRFADLFNPRQGTTFLRLQLWRASGRMFLEHPLLGVGLDNFLYHYRSRYIRPAAWQEPNLAHPHNVILDYATRLGLGGLLAGLWLQLAFWGRALPLRRQSDPDRRALALGLMGSMANFLAHGLVDASYAFIDLAFTFFITLSIVEWLQGEETHGIKI